MTLHARLIKPWTYRTDVRWRIRTAATTRDQCPIDRMRLVRLLDISIRKVVSQELPIELELVESRIALEHGVGIREHQARQSIIAEQR